LRAVAVSDELPLEIVGLLTPDEYSYIIRQLNGRLASFFQSMEKLRHSFGRTVAILTLLFIPTLGLSSFGILASVPGINREVRSLSLSLNQDISSFLRRLNAELLLERGLQLRASFESEGRRQAYDPAEPTPLSFTPLSGARLIFARSPASLSPSLSGLKGGMTILEGIKIQS
jgi:hypothetical protein